MKTQIITSAGVLLLGILMVTSVNAQSPRQGGRGQGPHGAGEAYSHQYAGLDLTDEQQTQITSLRTEHFKVMTPLRNKMAELKARERTLLSEENIDMKAVHKNIDEQTELMNNMKKLQVDQQLAVKNILTDEQVMKLQQRRQFARQDGFRGSGNYRGPGGQRGTGGDRGTRMGRGYRGI
jgi:Spy/CpxP family protein refolding chaperone